VADEPAFQDLFQDNDCWGCGRDNAEGLQIKSRWQGDESVCIWQPRAPYTVSPSLLNGGVIATIMDCHSVCTAVADAYRSEGRDIGSEPKIWYVTSSLNVTYLRPTPLSAPVTLKARVKEKDERRTTVVCSLVSGGHERARAEVVAVRVPETWQHAADEAG
jgi:acyl-coenzyme A thioesterase PaaI-like protein